MGNDIRKYLHPVPQRMSKLTAEMLEAMTKQGIFAFATASKDGVPNVVPVGMLFMGPSRLQFCGDVGIQIAHAEYMEVQLPLCRLPQL